LVGSALLGGAGNDFLGLENATGGNSTLDGGSGTNTVGYAAWSGGGVTVNLTTRTDSLGDVLINIQQGSGSTYTDSLIGSSGDDLLNGTSGADTIVANGGNDTIDASFDANALLQGGAGNDTFRIGTGGASAPLANTFDGGSGFNTVDYKSMSYG